MQRRQNHQPEGQGRCRGGGVWGCGSQVTKEAGSSLGLSLALAAVRRAPSLPPPPLPAAPAFLISAQPPPTPHARLPRTLLPRHVVFEALEASRAVSA